MRIDEILDSLTAAYHGTQLASSSELLFPYYITSNGPASVVGVSLFENQLL